MTDKCSVSGVDAKGAYECDRPVYPYSKPRGMCKTHSEYAREGKPLKRLTKYKTRQKVKKHEPDFIPGVCDMLPATRECTECGLTKPESEFGKQIVNGKKVFRAHCRECGKIYRLDYDFADGAAAFKLQCIKEQGGECACCGDTLPAAHKSHLHHDHAYAKSDPAGWICVLCLTCNLHFIGGLEQKSPAARERMIRFAAEGRYMRS